MVKTNAVSITFIQYLFLFTDLFCLPIKQAQLGQKKTQQNKKHNSLSRLFWCAMFTEAGKKKKKTDF